MFPTSIEQWCKCATNLDRHQRESRREIERLRGKWEQGALVIDQSFKGLSNDTTLVLSDTRELDRVLSTEQSTLYTNSHGPC